jgi:hypothetical protein
MNRRLSDATIRSTVRELLAAQAQVSGRRLRRVLRERFGAVGKTQRVFQIWREESSREESWSPAAAPVPPWVAPDVAELQNRVAVAELTAAETLARAERAEYREQAHQDKWATEIDRLRQQLRAQESLLRENRMLRDRVTELSRELMVAQAGGA